MFRSFLDAILARPDQAAVLCLGVLTVLFLHSHKQRTKGKPLPCPKGIPVLGNALQIQATAPWVQMAKWGAELGPIFRLNLGGQTAVVINDYRVASDLLDRRSSIYSDRPRMIMTSEIMCGGYFLPFMRYGNLWRKFRKAAHEGLSPQVAESYLQVHEQESAILVEALAKQPDAWLSHLYRAVASSTLSVCYGTPPIQSYDDPVVKDVQEFIHRLDVASKPGAYLVEMFPLLNRLPAWLAGWKRFGQFWHQRDTVMFTNLYEDAKRKSRLDKSLYQPSISSLLFEKQELDDKAAAWTLGSLFSAGAFTTAAIHQVFVLAMILHPQVMCKAQAEIDRVVGKNRMPNAGDRDKLPYIRAVMRETIRWRSVGPLGIPHYLIQDDVYEGYHIPKNSIVFFNEWAMNRDTKVYDDPENFRPERFLDETEQYEVIPPFTHDEGHTLFGYGRRRCPGAHVANNTILLNLATILWAFDIQKARDANGELVTPDPDKQVDEGIVVVPADFPASFVIRDPDGFQRALAQAPQSDCIHP
ncbi:cytochrome P450 [Cristinia sonorae]|uniref:Cytochrome P450 n=1 Tax=Cristinia sonorae TaxID=1940300 RepID=A0A8K0XLI7_9AGAR|nr:cytochrome P450 [Cristinia sonorae]